MRYVRFWRGSADDFVRIPHKNEDTMYFVIQPDTNSFTMYLGATELLNGDDLNSSSIDALEDVIISKKLYDRQVLMYDALQECWVNASLDKAAGAYVGPTAEYMGLPGMLPGAPAGSENLFFRSDGKWVEQHIEKVENIDKLQHIELIANITAQWPEVNKNDLIIIEDILFNNLKNDTAYWYDGKEWLSVTHNSIPSDYAENDPQAPSYILNRPFYDLRKQEPLDVTFDGNLEGKDVVSGAPLFNVNFVKLTDITPTKEELAAGTLTVRAYSDYQDEVTEAAVSELVVQDLRVDGYPLVLFVTEEIPFLFVAYEDGTVEGNTFTKGTYGVYVTIDEGVAYISRLFIPSVLSGEIKKLDNKFIDAEWMATAQRKEMVFLPTTIVEMGNEYAVENEMPSHPLKAIVTYDDGTRYLCNVSKFADTAFVFGNLAIVGMGADTGEPFLCSAFGKLFDVYLREDISVSMSVSIIYNDYEKLPFEFLPDGIGASPLKIEWDSNDIYAFFIALRDGWKAGRTVIVYGVQNVEPLRLLYLDVSDPLGEIFKAVFVTEDGDMYVLICHGGASGSFDGFVRLLSFGYDTFMDVRDTEGEVLVGVNEGFAPVMLNSTLTEGSTLPAQEGAVFTAIQEIKNLITPINEALEAALEGGN